MAESWFVYRLTFPNGKLYFGITSDIKGRVRSHRYAQQGRCPKRAITNAIHKYGWDNIQMDLLHNDISLCDAELLEQSYITEHKTQDFSKGYNIVSGGRVNKGYKHPSPKWGVKASDETRRRQSEAKKNDPFLKERSSKASTRFPVTATNTITGESFDFINARECGDFIGADQYTVYNHIARNSKLLAKTWNIRRK